MVPENLRFESLWVVRCDVYTSTDRGGGLSCREGTKKMGFLFWQRLTISYAAFGRGVGKMCWLFRASEARHMGCLPPFAAALPLSVHAEDLVSLVSLVLWLDCRSGQQDRPNRPDTRNRPVSALRSRRTPLRTPAVPRIHLEGSFRRMVVARCAQWRPHQPPR